MITPPFTTLMKFLAVRYPALGRPLKLAPMTFDYKVSNNLFEYATTTGRYLLKVMAHPRALYGHLDVRDRLETVGRAVFQLHRGGLPVEEVVPGEEAGFVQSYEGHLLRLYRFHQGRGYTASESDVRGCALALQRLHQEGRACLDGPTCADLGRFEKPYPLADTAAKLPDLLQFVREQALSREAYGKILTRWTTIERTVRRVVEHQSVWGQPTCLVHTDFHPRNVLFTSDGTKATMIDLDNMMVGPYLHCLAFSILRFAFHERDRRPEALHETMALFAPEAHHQQEFMDDLVHAMLHIEIEKVLRILQRVRTTGHYEAFVENITALHLPNIEFVSGNLVCA